MTSSPDPLGLSDENKALPTSPYKVRASSTTPRKPLIDVSGNSAVQDFYISTPTSKNKQSLPIYGKASSPWRVRVTLQAESTDGTCKAGGFDEEIMVTKIPLKGGDDASPVDANRGRGRPRKSLGSPIRRSGTPKPKNYRRKTVVDSAEVEEYTPQREMSPFAKRGDAFPKRRAKRSRSPKKQESQGIPVTPTLPMSENDTAAESKWKRSRSRKRRTEITPMKPTEQVDDSVSDSSSSLAASHQVQEKLCDADDVLDSNDNAEAPQSDYEAPITGTASSHAYPTIQEIDAEGREGTPDPTDEHHDFDTILESEGFSMVSVESLSSIGKSSTSPAGPNRGSGLGLPTDPRETIVDNPTSKEESFHGNSDISSFIPAAASPTKNSHMRPLEEESIHGYSDISSFIPATASPTKTSHLPVPMKTEISKRTPSIARSAHESPNIPSRPAVVPLSGRISLLRPKPKDRVSSRSPSILHSAHRSADISSMPANEPSYLDGTRQVALRTTPMDISSPTMPAAPVAVQKSSSTRPLNDACDGTPKLDRTRRAGSALQGLPSPKERMIQYSDRLGSPFQVYNKPSPSLSDDESIAKHEATPQAASDRSVVNADNLFSGFGAGTRRELRAGLRLGEELAKRQTLSASCSSPAEHAVEQSQHMTDRAAGYLKLPSLGTQAVPSPSRNETQQTEVTYPSLTLNQLPSPAESDLDNEEDDISRKADMPAQAGRLELPLNPHRRTRGLSPAQEAPLLENTIMAREAEWQREREAVSRQIQMANTSKVIVIDSDSSLQSQESDDETEASSVGFTAERPSPEVKSEPHSQTFDHFLQPEVSKPRRSQLPSPWRRSSQIYDAKQTPDVTNSDLFWQPNQSKGAKRRQQRKEQMSSGSTGTSMTEKDSIWSSEEEKSIRVPINEASAISEVAEAETSGRARRPVSKLSDSEVCGSFEEIGVSDSSGEGESNHMSESPEYEVSEQPKQSPILNRSDEIPQSNLQPREHRQADDISTASPTQMTTLLDGWSAEGLTLIDPQLLPMPQKATHGNNQDIATQISTISSPVSKNASTDPKPPATQPPAITSPPAPTTTWLSSLTNLFNSTLPPIPWYNSPTCGLPPATRSDILASSPFVALRATTPWTKAHHAALIPLYQSSWLFGAHIFAPSNPATSPTAKHISHTFTTPLGWSRPITAQDASVVDAFMILLAARSSRRRTNKDRHVPPPPITSEEHHHQYNIPAGSPITEEFVLRKCLEIWQDMIMCGDEEIRPERGETVGLRRKGDRLWRKGGAGGSWWDGDGESGRSQKGYFERKRRGWGGLPSWRAKGLVG